MKIRTILCLLFSVLCLTGCGSIAGNYADFIQKIPAATAVDVSAVTTTPVYTHSESASGIVTDPVTGLMSITNGKASITIPELGFAKQISISGLKLQATPEQLAAARAIAAAASAALPIEK